MIGDMTSFYDNAFFIAISGPANNELLSYQYIVCASQVFELVYQIHSYNSECLNYLITAHSEF